MESARLQAEFYRQLAPDEQIVRLFDLLPEVSFFIKNRKGQFIALSLNKFEHCGVLREEDAVGKTDHDFFPAARADAYRADDLAVMDSGQPIVNRMEAAPETLGSPRLVATSKIPLRDRRGRVIGIAGFSRPVAELGGDSDLSEYLWIARPIVVFADTPADPRYQDQLRMLLEGEDMLRDRDVIVLTDTDPKARAAVRTKLRPRGFQMVLVDKDGVVKLRKPSPWSVRDISRTIDRTPMRLQEVEERRGSQ